VENNGSLQLVTFRLGAETYGIDIMDVKGVVKLEEIRTIPNAPTYVEGILNLRGDIIPIINLHERFHFQKVELTEEDELLSCIVIIQINEMQLGIIIDKILRVITIEKKDIQPPPQMISGIGVKYIEGVFNDEGNYLIILDIIKLFSHKELQQLSSIKD
jgi:purine-binding chemotaxis protein CheW